MPWGKLMQHSFKDPQNENYKAQQQEIVDAIEQNKQNLDVQIDEMNRIKEFLLTF